MLPSFFDVDLNFQAMQSRTQIMHLSLHEGGIYAFSRMTIIAAVSSLTLIRFDIWASASQPYTEVEIAARLGVDNTTISSSMRWHKRILLLPEDEEPAYKYKFCSTDIRIECWGTINEWSFRRFQKYNSNYKCNPIRVVQTIRQMVDADPSCNVLFNTCANIIYELLEPTMLHYGR